MEEAKLMEFKCKMKVRYNECDMYGHVNHAVYLSYLENARIEFLDSLGISLRELTELGFRLFIVHISIDYRNAARFEDELTIITQISQLRQVGGKFLQQIRCGETDIAFAEVKWACIDRQGKPTRLPPLLQTHLPPRES